ncbi:glutaredoxin [Hydrocoleum sp. CS-953]|uniref:glutaredoxin family protein n=1 Tax=Hydrocoleum sp. CS-953 TaxID=1671698 RepID=UPI000BD361DF|nr:thioredoxin family protein [Hydrocoleum sp. CS-953]OZH55572.1 glutaredoxin [Hydrocoleum sp. CS-953]
MKAKYIFKILLTLILLVSLTIFAPVAQAAEKGLDIYFFYSKTCPHCAKQKPLMEYIDKQNEEVKVNSFEVSQNPQIWQEFLAKYQITSQAVPRTFIGDKNFIGYSETEGELEYNSVYKGYIGYRNQIIQAIETELGYIVNIPGRDKQIQLPWYIIFLPILYLCSYPLLNKKLNNEQRKRYWFGGLITTIIISLFFFITFTPDAIIKQFAQGLPFPLFVSTIALADGFNPCAFTVLIILLSLLSYTKSRRDMTLIGSTFVATSGVMYFLFIMIMILVGSVFLDKYGTIFMLVLGVIITLAGLINIKDYFFFKQAFSLSLSEKQQLSISKKAREIARKLQNSQGSKKMFLAALGGTILLAIFVNIVELGCTAILPAVYMTTLIQYCQENVWLCFSFWTGIYALIYIIPLLAILLNFIYSFKSSRLSESQGRILKLIGGTFMLFFGLVMIFKPEFLTFG